MADAQPNSLQEVALGSLRNSLPSGVKLHAFAFAAEPGVVAGKTPNINAQRTVIRNGEMVTERFVIDPTGRAVPA